MSRSAKSRAEKGRARTSVPTPVSVPPPSLQQTEVPSEIAPGGLTESTCTDIIEQEEGKEVVAELIDELMGHVLDRCYQVHLQRELVPFTVRWTWEVLVRTLEWRFLVRDEGEDADSALLCTEDPEPEPSITDSWAEGCVPTVYANQQTRRPLLQKLLDLNLEESVESSNANTPKHPESQQPHRPIEVDLQSAKAINSDKIPTPPAFQNKHKGNHSKQQALLKPIKVLPRRPTKPLEVFPLKANDQSTVTIVRSTKTPIRPDKKQRRTEMGRQKV